jgi:hypothetical protein
MTGLDPAIQQNLEGVVFSWMAASRPAMTVEFSASAGFFHTLLPGNEKIDPVFNETSLALQPAAISA